MISRIRRSVIPVFLLLLSLLLSAGEDSLTFHGLSTEDGLSQNMVHTILQDSKGFMWFGSQDGLNRYDGHQFVIYRYSPDDPYSLSHNHVVALCEDNEGFLWAGTVNGGLNRFDPSLERFTRFQHDPGNPDSLTHDAVNVVYQDGRGSLWIGTAGGLDRFDDETGGFFHYRHEPGHPESLSHNDVRTLIEDAEGNLWIGTWGGGLNCLHRDNKTFSRFMHSEDNPDSLIDDRVSALQLDYLGNIYVGTADGFTYFNPGTGVFKTCLKPAGIHGDEAGNRINALFKDTSDYLWIGTEKGVYRFNSTTNEITGFKDSINVPAGFCENRVFSFYKDRADVLWIGSGQDGIVKIKQTAAQFMQYVKDAEAPGSFVDSSVNAVYLDGKGLLWIGTQKGLKCLNRETNQFVHYKYEPDNPHSMSFDEVRFIYEDRAGVMWVGTRGGGLNRFDRATEQFTRFQANPADPSSSSTISNDFTECILEDHAGNLWIGTHGGGLDCLDPARKRFSHYRSDPGVPSSLNDDNVRVVFEDHSHVLWVGTDSGGLNRLDGITEKGAQFTHFKHDPLDSNTIGHNFVLCIYEDSAGVLWIGTVGAGLNRLDEERKNFSLFMEKDGLPNNVVYGILEDDDGLLWISTNKGLSHFDPKKKTFKNYDWTDGLQDNEFNFGSYFKSKNGEMFFGGVNGFNSFFPQEIHVNRYIPPVVITGLQLFNKPVPICKMPKGRVILDKSITETDVIKLSNRENVLTFQYAALSFISSQRNQYMYIMEGYEDNWNEVGNRHYATYINLPPGNYVFRVKGSNNDHVWNEKGASLRVIIIPPFWQTLWFKVVALMALVSLIYFLYYRRIRGIEQKRKELEKMVDLRTQEVQKEREVALAANQSKSQFLARMSHEIRTPMSAVIGFADMLLDTGLNEEQADYVKYVREGGKTILALLDDILDLSRIEAGQLTFDPIDFDPEIMAFDVCELMAPRVGEKPIDLLCRIGNRVPAFIKTDAGRFRQVLLNLVGNAIKFTEQGKVELCLEVDEEEETRLKMHTYVRDTGIGIPPEKLEGIFEVFRQAENFTSRLYGGSGLGLPICRQIANLMGGNVWAESKPGEGSAFHFTAWVEKSLRTGVPKAVPVVLPGKKILVVDDNMDGMQILTRRLEDAGMRTKGLYSGEEVAAELQRAYKEGDPYDLCLLDIQLPGMSGYDVLKQIRALDSPVAAIPVLGFSSAGLNRAKKYRAAGFDGFLPRPLHWQKLVEMAARLLGEKKTVAGERTLPEEKGSLLTRYTLVEEAKIAVRILVVEDNLINQKLMRSILSRSGYTVDIVSNGEEAVNTFTANPEAYDLIFMDIQMPVMDGLTATRIIREKGFTDIPVIAVTAGVMKGEQEKLMEAGLNDFIPKPVKRDVVFAMVKKWAIEREEKG